MDMILINYTYPEFIAAVIIMVELIKYLANPKLHPKWITLVVAIMCAVIELAVRGHGVNVWFLVISLGVAVLGYDYIIKPIKDKVNPNKNQ